MDGSYDNPSIGALCLARAQHVLGAELPVALAGGRARYWHWRPGP